MSAEAVDYRQHSVFYSALQALSHKKNATELIEAALSEYIDQCGINKKINALRDTLLFLALRDENRLITQALHRAGSSWEIKNTEQETPKTILGRCSKAMQAFVAHLPDAPQLADPFIRPMPPLEVNSRYSILGSRAERRSTKIKISAAKGWSGNANGAPPAKRARIRDGEAESNAASATRDQAKSQEQLKPNLRP